ncbi:MAG: hypothetical protein NCW75_09015 [Phycisphaera sp.]|nr:MAG: hypothetical protein NCW75_09015 [Phycisphaera sp.]
MFVRCPFCQYDLSGIPDDYACPECSMDPGDRNDPTRTPDRQLKILTWIYVCLWIPVWLALPVAFLCAVLAYGMYGIDPSETVASASGRYPGLDRVAKVAGALALYTFLLWFAAWPLGATTLGLRLWQQRRGRRTPAGFWCLAFGPIAACPIVYIATLMFVVSP